MTRGEYLIESSECFLYAAKMKLKGAWKSPLATQQAFPVVALSANGIPRDAAKSSEAGFFRHLTKPIKIKEFIDTLKAALEFAEKRLPEAQNARFLP